MHLHLTEQTHLGDLMLGTSHGTSETIATLPGEWHVQFSTDHQQRLMELGLYLDAYVGELEPRELRLSNPLYVDSRWLTLSTDENWWPEQEDWVNDRMLAVDESPEEWTMHPDGFTWRLDAMCLFDVFVTLDGSGNCRTIRLARRD